MLGGAFKKRKQDICWSRIEAEETTEVLGETTAVLEDSTHIGKEHVRYIEGKRYNKFVHT